MYCRVESGRKGEPMQLHRPLTYSLCMPCAGEPVLRKCQFDVVAVGHHLQLVHGERTLRQQPLQPTLQDVQHCREIIVAKLAAFILRME